MHAGDQLESLSDEEILQTFSENERHEPWFPRIYSAEQDLPFAADGISPSLPGRRIENAIGISEPFQKLRCVRKFITEHGMDAGELSIRRQMVHEARLLYAARHYHVVQLIHTYFQAFDEDEYPFAIVMERADNNLRHYLRRGRIPSASWFGCLIQVVHYIHGLGIRHRDIKPRNILIKDGKPLLADFGLSQMGLGKTMPTTILTRLPGRTPGYCAPEVANGSTRGRSADIFSLGAVFLEMLAALDGYETIGQLRTIVPEDTGSYSANISELQDWMANKFQLQSWQRDLLTLCQKMLLADRHVRPSADRILQEWLSLHDYSSSLLCRCVNDSSTNPDEGLVAACQSGTTDDVATSLKKAAQPQVSSAIHFAATRGSTTMVQMLLEAGAAVDTRNAVGQTALQCASRNGCLDVVQLLLQSRADVDA
ncbi:hypothetical protein M409DRAFT_71663 [Zasmidium cellare ATCC 36951]|uniref:Protein kinase domain-containing protein n=1 Tax=Zasmidium cellare ATCC 36951 TaxID=1080233 RepID=A0A6A6BUC6_ZASCE|nr:uncharacterized protein M409DRAFT_71663 [Zasmidium cellare ATCC 36951]KAF2158407.1 hypothetical protein M409DRAFT_71663 [Zasmidium cellare ATCC 36951]